MPTKIPSNADCSHNKSGCKEYPLYSYDLHSLLPLPLMSVASFSEEWLLKWFWEGLCKCTCHFNVLSEKKKIKELFGKKMFTDVFTFSPTNSDTLKKYLSRNIFLSSLPSKQVGCCETLLKKQVESWNKSTAKAGQTIKPLRLF